MNAPEANALEVAPALRRTIPGWLVSLITHLCVLTALGLCYFELTNHRPNEVIAALLPQAEEIETIDDHPMPLPIAIDPTDALASLDTPDGLPDVEIAPSADDIEHSTDIEPPDTWQGTLPPGDLTQSKGQGDSRQTPYGQRGERGALVTLNCGSSVTESAVAAALRWLIQHQRSDGSWSFDHRHGPCKTNPGTLVDAHNGATGLALLPLLGAGHTHRDGQYKQQVRAGLAYLIRNMKIVDGKAGQLTDSGNLYSHGICAIVLCEAYGMTNDRELLAPAQAAINYIVAAQDPVGGGWRYQPQQAGDTSVVGWQLMALKSGHMSYLHVPPATVKGCSLFLDSVQADSGSAYGYTSSGEGLGTSSVGLLCRMYLGWKKDHGALERGVARLGKAGPSKTNLYYNYYATQVMRHYGGEEWKKWNAVMPGLLTNAQAKAGPEQGSWYIAGDHGSERGGRVYCTAMSAMILEVYYRHLRIYDDQAAEDDFPL